VTASTKRILIEGAFFDHSSVWRTARRLELSTEASYRFERGVDVGAVPYVLARAASMIQMDTKCRVARGRMDVYPEPAKARRFLVSPKRINRLLGTSIPEQEMCDYLEGQGFTVIPGKDLEVIVPARRSDVECEADIAEDVARLYGYDRIGEKTTLTSQGDAAGAGDEEHTGRPGALRDRDRLDGRAWRPRGLPPGLRGAA
jgi:phenylalanyl-tRNA synthetase beta chain